MDKFSFIANADPVAIENMYEKYAQNPDNVDATWQHFFQGFDFAQSHYDALPTPISGQETKADSSEIQVRNLIFQYRSLAHLKSDTNPVRKRRQHRADFSLEHFGLKESDNERLFEVGYEVGLGKAKLKDIVSKLKKVYLGAIGFEYTHIREPEIINWLINKIENEGVDFNPSKTEKLRILSKLNEAVVFENFLHTKFLGQKRFSLEGGENTIPALDTIINSASELGAEEVVIGMAHRGRLNVLANIMGKTYEEIFSEFEGNQELDLTMGDGDVKYHLGYSSFVDTTSGRKIYLKLAPNPSHLEAVDPVVLGYTRAQIDDEYRGDFSKAIPIIIHGDAAIAGQGIVYECVQMSGLAGYATGGTIHFVINNQVGFTTDYDDARSSIYCTDLAKIIDAPILHVNGDDPEAVQFCAKLAVAYRQQFHKDIFIDLLGYRRHGHNESDEPKFTQPKLYQAISKHPNPREIYVKKLIESGDFDDETVKKLDKEFKQLLQDRLNEIKQKPLPYKPQKIEEEWHFLSHSKPQDFDVSPETKIKENDLQTVANILTQLPETFKPLKQIEKLIAERKTHFFDKKSLSWADAELLAYGTLLNEGKIVRMSGQDVKRGTFSHRHAYLFDSETNEPYCPLNHIREGQEPFAIYNSLLSEYAVLGFEYGYAMATPNALVIWEAQFGDFANGAQVMIDQFITSAETKWQRMNGLVMFLPHGYEGQGPEHSSARIERFLQMAAEDNIVVANVTKSANLFHLLRRQIMWNFRKPCILFTPKSLLRHPGVHSPISAFTKEKFNEVYEDTFVNKKEVKRVLLCTGKIYFDLLEAQQKENRKDVAIMRIEQLSPYPKGQIQKILNSYNNPELYWVQEEPENMGAWGYILRVSQLNLNLIARKTSASPATGFAKIHKKEQENIVKKAFNLK